MIKNYFLLTFYFKENNLVKKVFDYGDSLPLKNFKDENEEILIIGHPSVNKLININKFYLDLKKNNFSKEFIQKIDGEFLIIKIDYKKKEVLIYNSRFASPPLYYYFVDQFLIKVEKK